MLSVIAKIFLNGMLRLVNWTSSPMKRWFFGAMDHIFNSVSKERVDEVGPDRACAEWLMRNSADIRWVGRPRFAGHYNVLPLESTKSEHRLCEVKAQEASLTYAGFYHFDGCKHVESIVLDKCLKIDDKCMELLNYLEDSLTHLRITGSPLLTRAGLLKLTKLKKLKTLELGSLSNVKDLESVISEIHLDMPQCKIIMV